MQRTSAVGPQQAQQILFHRILAELQKPSSELPAGWQRTASREQRAVKICQIVSSLKLIPTESDERCINVALVFERKTFETSPSKEVYEQTIDAKLATIQQKRESNVPNLQEHMMNPRNGMNMQANQLNPSMNMGMTGNMPFPNAGLNMPNAAAGLTQPFNPMFPQQLSRPMQPPALQQSQQQQQQQQQQQTMMNMAAMQMNRQQSIGQPNMGNQPQNANQMIIEMARGYAGRLSEEHKQQIRQRYLGSLNEAQRTEFLASGKDPLNQWCIQKARTDLMRNQMQRQSSSGMQPGNNAAQRPNSQPGGGLDPAGFYDQQANAIKMQGAGETVVPASNGLANPMTMTNPGNGTQGINPQMLANSNNTNMAGIGGQMTDAQQMLIQAQQAQQNRQRATQQMLAQRQAATMMNNSQPGQTPLQGQPGGLNAPGNFGGGAGLQLNSPAMSMLNRPVLPPGQATPGAAQPGVQQPTPNVMNGNNQHVQHSVNGMNPQTLSQFTPQQLQQLRTNFQQRAAQQTQQTPNLLNPAIREKLANMPEEERRRFLARHPNVTLAQTQQSAALAQSGMQNANTPQNLQQTVTPNMNMLRMNNQQPGSIPAPPLPATTQQPVSDQQRQQQQNLNQAVLNSLPFPRQITTSLQMPNLPNNLTTWQELKNYITANEATLPPGSLARLNAAQRFYYTQNPPQNFGMIVKNFIEQQKQKSAQAQAQAQQTQAQSQAQAQAQTQAQAQAQAQAQQLQLQQAQQQQQHQQRQIQLQQQQLQQRQIQQQQAHQQQLLQQQQHQQSVQPQPQLGQQQAARPVQTVAPTANMQMPPQTMPITYDQIPPQARAQLEPTPQETAKYRSSLPPHLQHDDEAIRKQLMALKWRHMSRMISMRQNKQNQEAQLANNPVDGSSAGQANVAMLQEQRPQTANMNASAPVTGRPGQGPMDDLVELSDKNNQAAPSNLATPNAAAQQAMAAALARMSPAERATFIARKREAARRQQGDNSNNIANANANAGGQFSAPNNNQPASSNPMSYTSLERAKLTALYKEMHATNPKGPRVALDQSGLNQALHQLRKLVQPLNRIDQTYVYSLRTPNFPEQLLRNAVRAKTIISHNIDANGNIKDFVGVTLEQLMELERYVVSYFKIISQIKERVTSGQIPPPLPHLASPRMTPAAPDKTVGEPTQPQQPPQPPAPAAKKSAPQPSHVRKSSAAGKVPAAPTEHRTFDWGAGGAGVPKYDGRNELTPDKLKFPPNKKRKAGADSAASTPAAQAGTPAATAVSPAVGPNKITSPEQTKKAPVPTVHVEKVPEREKRHRCQDQTCEYSHSGFDTEDELKQHIKVQHELIGNPLDYLLETGSALLLGGSNQSDQKLTLGEAMAKSRSQDKNPLSLAKKDQEAKKEAEDATPAVPPTTLTGSLAAKLNLDLPGFEPAQDAEKTAGLESSGPLLMDFDVVDADGLALVDWDMLTDVRNLPLSTPNSLEESPLLLTPPSEGSSSSDIQQHDEISIQTRLNNFVDVQTWQPYTDAISGLPEDIGDLSLQLNGNIDEWTDLTVDDADADAPAAKKSKPSPENTEEMPRPSPFDFDALFGIDEMAQDETRSGPEWDAWVHA